MLNLDALTPDLQLLCWNEELPSSGTGDPLGLTLRVGARLSAELSHCITSITPRARYYSFFPWAFDRALAALGEDAPLNELISHVLLDERAMLLGAVLHHDCQSCEGGALQGSNDAIGIARDPARDPIDLRAWRHLEQWDGGFAAYKGSLINLGLFAGDEGDGPDLDKPEDQDEGEAENANLTSGRLSKAGKQLARDFGASVAGASYLTLHPESSPVTFDKLKEFGSLAGLCELRSASACDLIPLRGLFFAAGIDGTENSHFRRRMTLLLTLHAVQVADAHGEALTRKAFDDLTFYRRITKGDEALDIDVDLPPQLGDIAERWRIFHFHSYLTTALESLLAGLVRALRGMPSGLSVNEIIDSFDTPDAAFSLREHLPFDSSQSFWDLTPTQALALVGIETGPLLQADPNAADDLRNGETIERRLRSLLIDEGLVSGAAGPAVAVLLLYALLLRFKATVEEHHQGWNRRKVLNPHGDVSLPGVLDVLHAEFGDSWWGNRNREILSRILVRFVIRQHETMSYERGFGGSPPLFHLDGERVVGNDIGRDDVDPGNARFPSLLQILRDLHLIEDEDSRQKLTEDGRALLTSELAGLSS